MGEKLLNVRNLYLPVRLKMLRASSLIILLFHLIRSTTPTTLNPEPIFPLSGLSVDRQAEAIFTDKRTEATQLKAGKEDGKKVKDQALFSLLHIETRWLFSCHKVPPPQLANRRRLRHHVSIIASSAKEKPFGFFVAAAPFNRLRIDNERQKKRSPFPPPSSYPIGL